MCPAIPTARRRVRPSGCAPTVIISRKPKGLASADREQDFLPEGILELLELQRRFTFIAEHFEHRRPALFRHLYAAVFEVHDVHLQRLDLKVPVVAAIWTGQRQNQLSPPAAPSGSTKPDSMWWLAAGATRNRPKNPYLRETCRTLATFMAHDHDDRRLPDSH